MNREFREAQERQDREERAERQRQNWRQNASVNQPNPTAPYDTELTDALERNREEYARRHGRQLPSDFHAGEQ